MIVALWLLTGDPARSDKAPPQLFILLSNKIVNTLILIWRLGGIVWVSYFVFDVFVSINDDNPTMTLNRYTATPWIFQHPITVISYERPDVSNHRQLDCLGWHKRTHNGCFILTHCQGTIVIPNKWPVMQKAFPFHYVIMNWWTPFLSAQSMNILMKPRLRDWMSYNDQKFARNMDIWMDS